MKDKIILGFGREGKSTYRFLKNNNVNCLIGIADVNDITDEEVLKDNVALHTGKNYLEAMNEYDIVMKTPGQSFKDVNLTGIREKITSQAELFLKYGGSKIIGITGTKGKSTTSSLIYAMLKQKYNTLLVGNIGLPAFDEMDMYNEMDYFVYEFSSHQLQFIDYSPHIAILLNMYEDHLDHYKDYEEYKEAFAGFYWTQEMYTHNDNWEEDWARMLNKDIEVLNELNPDLPMLMSPFFSAAYRSTPERIEAQYRNMLRLTNFRKGDIMCPQDSYGAFDFSIRYVEEGLAAIARAVEEDGRLRFWVNCENFGNDSMRGDNHANDLAPGDISRFVAQLHIAAAYAEKMITFSYSHHYNPNIPSDRHPARAERGRLNHKAYVQYAARFACWDD